MVQAELLGAHVHQTVCGTKVQIWRRGDVYLARGRYQQHQFGKTLGANPIEAASALRHLLVEIENGTFERPTEARRRPLKTGQVARLNVCELCSRFLAETRKLRGKDTAQNYQSRLVPVIEFAEQPESKRRWPLAMDVDREFAIQLRSGLFARIVTRNGHPASIERPMSPRQVFNVLDCVRSMLNWAKRPDVHQLPATFANPFTQDIVGRKAKKDPLRPIPIPVERRIALVERMDAWQLCQFAIPLVLPLRPEDYAGLLISEVDFQGCLLRFGTRLAGRDFNKGRQSFSTPFPVELIPILQACAGSRIDGPLLRRRAVWEGRVRPKLEIQSHEDTQVQFDRALASAPEGEIQAAQDSKRTFRRLLQAFGGVSVEGLSKEFKPLLRQIGAPNTVRFYDLRGSCNSEMERSHVSYLVQRYVTGHDIGRDIMSEYVTLGHAVTEVQKYFQAMRPLMTAIERRAVVLGITREVRTAG
jgi:hypothetical protein